MSAPRVDRDILGHARENPAAPAVACDGVVTSYGELAAGAAAVAAALRQAGIGAGERVLLGPRRNAGAISALLGIWRAGAVAVPLPAGVPAARLAALVADCAPRAAVGGELPPGVPQVDASPPPRASGSHGADGAERDDAPAGGDADAYVIYTSGTTGVPKGVVVTHAALHHYVAWQAEAFAVDAGERFTQIAQLAFDFALKEILVPLVRGASVWIVPEALRVDGRGFFAWLAAQQITTACCLPLLFREMTTALAELDAPARARSLSRLRRLHVSGDMLYWDDVERWQRVAGDGIELVNMYGPTESTVIKACYRVPRRRPAGAAGPVPVGAAIDGAVLRVERADGTLCAPGERGAVVIVSSHLARGYTDPAATAGRFDEIELDGRRERCYRTGDVGALDADGVLTLAGRADQQVKVQGVRVEPAGVEAVLRPHAGDVAVVAVPAAGAAHGELELACAFVAGDTAATEAALRAVAVRELAPAEVPSRFVALATLPRTVNGKLDRERLGALLALAPAQLARPSGSCPQLLEQVMDLWRQVLAVEAVPPDANFYELGGDSMRSVALLRLLRSTFDVRLRLADIVEDMTPLGICRRLERQAEST